MKTPPAKYCEPKKKVEPTPNPTHIESGDWHYLAVGEPFRKGDVYGTTFCFEIGTEQTVLQIGQPCPEFVMGYKPRRKIVVDKGVGI